MTTYDVSRATVRKSIETLVVDGLLHRDPRQGHLRGPAAAGEPAAPRVVQPGHAPPRPHPLDPACSASRRDAPARRGGHRARASGRDDAGLAAGPGPARRRAADRARERLVPRSGRSRTSTARTSSGSLYQVFADGPTASASTRAEQTLWGESADAAPSRTASTPRCTPRCSSSGASRAPASRPLEHVVSRYRGDRYQVHMSLGRDHIGPVSTTTEGNDHVSTSDATAGTEKRSRGFNLGPLQKFGRSLDAADRRPPRRGAAAAARPARPARRRRPGLGQHRRRHRRRRQRDLREPAAPVRARRGDRHGQEGRRLDRARRRRRLPRVQGRRRRDVADRARRSRPRARPRSSSTTASSAASSSASPPASCGSATTASSLPPYLAFFGGRRFVPIITAFAAIVISVLLEPGLPDLRRRAHLRRRPGSPRTP